MREWIDKRINILIPFAIGIFSIFIVFSNVGTGIINSSDHKYPFDFYKLFSSQLYTWNDNIFLGFNQSLSLLLNLSYTALFAFIQQFISDYVIINRIEYILAIFCNFYFTYLFLASIFPYKIKSFQKALILLCASFFFTNVLSTGLFYGGASQQIFAFSFIPLALYGLRKYLITGNKIYLLLVIVSLLFISSFNLPYGFISIGAVIMIILSFNDLSKWLKVKYISFFIVSFVLLNAYWIVPFSYSAFISPPQSFYESINSKDGGDLFSGYLKDISSRYSLDQVLKLTPNFDLIKKQNGDNSQLINYYASNYLIMLSYLSIILIAVSYLFFPNKKNNEMRIGRAILLVFFLLFIFLSKGQNSPFSDIYPFILEKTTFFKMFRDSMKWMIIPYLIFIILSANVLLNTKSRMVKFIIILFFSSYIFTWIYGGLMGRLRAYDVPEYYSHLSDSYQKIEGLSNKRAVILDSYVGPTSYQFDEKNLKPLSSNILKYISPMPVVDLFSNGGGLASGYLNNFFKGLEKNDADLYKFQKIGATHLYHQKDIINSGEYNYSDKYFEKSSFGLIDIYALKKEYVMPKIFLSAANNQAESYFFKISPVKYRIRINNLKEDGLLSFLYTFDQNWGLYLNKINKFPECIVVEDAKIINDEDVIHSSECLVGDNSFRKKEWGYLLKNEIFDDEHGLLNEVFNKWKVRPEYIKQNFSKEYYVENPDGSIDIDLVLYFKPQSYFYLGLLISGATLLASLGYLGYDWRKRRKMAKVRKEKE